MVQVSVPPSPSPHAFLPTDHFPVPLLSGSGPCPFLFPAAVLFRLRKGVANTCIRWGAASLSSPHLPIPHPFHGLPSALLPFLLCLHCLRILPRLSSQVCCGHTSPIQSPLSPIQTPHTTPIRPFYSRQVRCERASAFMRNKGVENVFQLEGGIHRYLDAYPEVCVVGTPHPYPRSLTPPFSPCISLSSRVAPNGRAKRPCS